jgi:hypothetical protein
VADSPDPADRRVAPRFQPTFGTVCRFAATSTDRPPVGLVWNISETGVSMLLPEPLTAGAELAAELGPEAGGPGLPVTLTVVHVREVPTGDYFLGAQFAHPLGEDEMRPFVSPASLTRTPPPKR